MSIQRYSFTAQRRLEIHKEDEGDYVLYTAHAAELHNLLSTLADIRAALGVGEKPMLSDLPKIVREVREQADRDEKAARKAQSERDAAVRERDAAVRERDAVVEILKDALSGFMLTQKGAEYPEWHWSVRVRAALAKIDGEHNA